VKGLGRRTPSAVNLKFLGKNVSRDCLVESDSGLLSKNEFLN